MQRYLACRELPGVGEGDRGPGQRAASGWTQSPMERLSHRTAEVDALDSSTWSCPNLFPEEMDRAPAGLLCGDHDRRQDPAQQGRIGSLLPHFGRQWAQSLPGLPTVSTQSLPSLATYATLTTGHSNIQRDRHPRFGKKAFARKKKLS